MPYRGYYNKTHDKRDMNRDRLDFGNERIGSLFRALFFPTLIGMVFNSLLNICDGMFVGHGVGSDALAAINIVAPVFLLWTGIGLMFGIGSSVICSIRMAENNVKAARIIMTQAFAAGTLMFIVFAVATLLFTHQLLAVLGCSDALDAYAMDYLLWILPGLFFLYVECVGMILMRLDGSPRYAMAIQVGAALLNIFLDWLMVWQWEMGIAGAAIATSISCAAGALLILLYFIFSAVTLRFYRLRMTVKSLRLSLRNVGYMIKIGSATFLSELAMGVMMVTGNYAFMSMLGEAGVAAYSVGCYLFPIIFSINNAVAQAAQPIISFNHGAGHPDRVRSTLQISIGTAIICGLLITTAMWSGAPMLSGLFIPAGDAAHDIAAAGLPLLGTCTVFFALNITFIGYYQSIENAARSTAYTMLRGILFLVPSFIVLPPLLGEKGLWLAIPAAEVLTLAVIAVEYLRRHRD